MKNSKCKMQNESAKAQRLKYLCPELEIVELNTDDIITTSPGTETTPKDESDGIWDLDIG